MSSFKTFSRATNLFRNRFGQVRGTILWCTFLQEKWLQPGRLFAVRIPMIKHPIFLRARSSDVEAFIQIFCRAELDAEIDPPVSYIIDAGANIGLASIFLANKFPGATIDALEVSEENLGLLIKNIAPYAKVRVIPKGLWGRPAFLRIKNPDAAPWAFQVEETQESDPESIPAVGVTELLASRSLTQVDLLKVDIEGAETAVFDGESSAWLSNVETLMVETHDRFKPGCTEAILVALGQRPFSYEKRGEYHIFRFGEGQSRA